MPTLPADFDPSEIPTAAKLNEYLDYMAALPVNQAEESGHLIFGGPFEDTWLSKPVTGFQSTIRTLTNPSTTEVKIVELGPYIELEPFTAALYFMDGRIQGVSGSPGSASLQLRQVNSDVVNAPTEFYRNTSSSPVRAGISGVYFPSFGSNEDFIRLTVAAIIPAATTVLVAQTRLTVLRIRET